MKVALVNTPFRIPTEDGREKYAIGCGSRWPFFVEKRRRDVFNDQPFPFYMGYAAALLLRERFDVYVRDGIALNETEESTLTSVVAQQPDLLVVETAANKFKGDVKFAKAFKRLCPSALVAFAGMHVSADPQSSARDSHGAVDYLLLREYEVPLLNLTIGLSGKPLLANDGIARVNHGLAEHNSRFVETPLDSMPFPARHLFPTNDAPNINRYYDGFCTRRPAVQMLASRGCPMKCDFCAPIHVMLPGMYRPRRVDLICDEIEECVDKYGAKEIYFDDDTFTGNRNHVLDFCDEFLRRGLNFDVSWSAMCDFIITDRRMIKRMHEAGCVGMKFGVESGDLDCLKEINKPINQQRLVDNCKLCNELFIKTHATFSFGNSKETPETMQRTLEFAKNLPSDTAQFSITTPFPGTPLFKKLSEAGRIEAKEWEHWDGLNECVVKFDGMTSGDVAEFHAKADKEWLRNKLKKPDWLKRQAVYFACSLHSQGFGLVKRRIKQTLAAI